MVAPSIGIPIVQIKNFYRAFEEKHRGPRELIIHRLKVYLPFVEPLKHLYPNGGIFDIGCGRGEWLELMKSNGFSEFGMDLDAGMLSACLDIGLKAIQGDAIEHLATLPSESQVIVSAFQLVEHITFEQLQILALEAHRVLCPGGLLILETPNPENIIVSTNSFYLDPTHQRPIPPLLLSFLPEYYGYARTKIVRLQESKELLTGEDTTLFEVFDGVSPDYSVVAQKTAAEDILQRFEDAFVLDFGLTLNTLTQKYETKLTTSIQIIEKIAKQAEERATLAEERFTQIASELITVYHSRSWRLTAPYRWLGAKLKKISH